MGSDDLEMAPYNSISDLSDPVRNALPVAAQHIFINAFNSSYAKDKDEKKAFRVAWGAVKTYYKKGTDGKWVKK